MPRGSAPAPTTSSSSFKTTATSHHVATKLKWIPEYKGSKQQWCVVCGMKTSECCAHCSTWSAWLPIHYKCMAEHHRDPDKYTANGHPGGKKKRSSDDDNGEQDRDPRAPRSTGAHFKRSRSRVPPSAPPRPPQPRRYGDTDDEEAMMGEEEDELRGAEGGN
mmetsp:Transcript_6411/g.9843  ORF Transcript_6411/g.9843 Transcript_6411/m.9843 type:complete len:162 (-) Transcript_6411:773-1258(-)